MSKWPTPTAQTLRDMRKLLSDPARWTKDHYVAHPRVSVSYTEAPAVRDNPDYAFCILGAAYAVSRCDGDPELAGIGDFEIVITKMVMTCVPEYLLVGADVPSFNDSRLTEHQDVLNVLDCAIARQEQIEAAAAPPLAQEAKAAMSPDWVANALKHY